MQILLMYLATLIPFLIIDITAIRLVIQPLFERHVGSLLADETRLGVALGFYLIYVAGIVFFAVFPAAKSGGVIVALMNGAVLGLMAYGTYEATNMATLRGWSWSMVAVDTLWGMLLTGGTAVIGLLIYRALTA